MTEHTVAVVGGAGTIGTTAAYTLGVDRPDVDVRLCDVAGDEAAALMHHIDDLAYVRLEEPERIGIRDHDPGDVAAAGGLHGLEIGVAVIIARNLHRVEAGHGDACRVGAVRAVGNEHLRPPAIAAVCMVAANHEHPGELALRAGRRLQGYPPEAADPLEEVLEPPHELETPLGELLGLEGMLAYEPRGGGRPLVYLRVVLHRTGSEWIEVGIDCEVRLGEPGEVANHLELAHLRKIGRGVSQEVDRRAGSVACGVPRQMRFASSLR